MSVTNNRSSIAALLRGMADQIESDDADLLEFTLEAKRFPRMTAEKIKEKEKAASEGWVCRNDDPSTLSINYEGTRL